MDTEAQDGAEVQDGAKVLSKGCSLAEVSEGPPAQWSVPEVCAWLDARCGDGDLVQLAAEHGVSGRALLRMTEGTLRRMGVAPRSRRRELLRELLGLRLQQELEELLSIAGDYCQPPLTRIPTVNCDGCTQLLDLAHSSLARAPKKERPRP